MLVFSSHLVMVHNVRTYATVILLGESYVTEFCFAARNLSGGPSR